MEPKKNPEADLEKKVGMLLLVGVAIALSVTLVAFEWMIFEQDAGDLGELVVELEEEEMIPITQQEPPPPPPPPQQAPPQIEIVDDEEEIEEELEIEDSEIDEDTEIEPIVQEEEVAEEPEIFTIVEDPPLFPGGEAAMRKWLGRNIHYPQMAKDAGIQGTVYVKFEVDQNGNVKDAQILRGIGGGCDEEALRVVNKMPTWKPGKQRGRAVRVYFNLPVRFTLR